MGVLYVTLAEARVPRVAPASSCVFHSWGSAARDDCALPSRDDGGSVTELRMFRRLSSRSRAAAASLRPASVPGRHSSCLESVSRHQP